ncbi:MAG: EamA family transporter [Candidatus Competibacteraceae bacterium]|nr:EamA family transporter [Candidatus Competibacteraceae bacterium]
MLDNAYLLIGVSVLMHVTWNLLARQVEAKANYIWWGLLAHLIMLGPYAVWSLVNNAHWDRFLLLSLAATSTANTVYFIALRRAYHYAPVALVYPLARSSPLLIALWSWLFFAEDISFLELSAISVSVSGLWILAASSRYADTRHALPWAACAAFATSLYSLSDKVAVSYLPGFFEQLGFITVGYSASFIGLSVVQRYETGRWIPAFRPSWTKLVVGGLFIGTAYALIVRAMRDLPAAHVVSFTNTGIVLAVLLSISVFHERAHWQQRLYGALVVSFGLILLGWGR